MKISGLCSGKEDGLGALSVPSSAPGFRKVESEELEVGNREGSDMRSSSSSLRGEGRGEREENERKEKVN